MPILRLPRENDATLKIILSEVGQNDSTTPLVSLAPLVPPIPLFLLFLLVPLFIKQLFK